MNNNLMNASKLLSLRSSLCYCRRRLLQISPDCQQMKNNYHSSQTLLNSDRKSSQEIGSTPEDRRTIYDTIKYTTSDAHLKHKAYENFRWSDQEVEDTPVYERPILVISAAIFFLYFGYFREQNDLDQKMNANLFDLVPGLEIPLIETAIRDAERVGNDTRKLRERLNEVKQLKQEVDKLEANKTIRK